MKNGKKRSSRMKYGKKRSSRMKYGKKRSSRMKYGKKRSSRMKYGKKRSSRMRQILQLTHEDKGKQMDRQTHSTVGYCTLVRVVLILDMI